MALEIEFTNINSNMLLFAKFFDSLNNVNEIFVVLL